MKSESTKSESTKGEIRISIVVPVYNMEKYIRRALDSILEQTFQDYEVILVDDGSSDRSGEICEEYGSLYGFTVIRQENAGVSVARNRGLDTARGKWIAFLDPDDYWEPDFLETLHARAKKPADIVAMGCAARNEEGAEDVHFFSGDLAFSDSPKEIPGFQSREKYELLCELMDVNYGLDTEKGQKRPTGIGVPWGKLYRRKFLVKNEIRFDPKLYRMQDNIFNMYAFEAARTVLYLDRSSYVYNLEHIHRYTVAYNPRAAAAFARVCGYRYHFLKDTGRLKDYILRDLYEREAQKLAFWILTSSIVNKENPDSDEQKIKAMKKTFETKPFQAAFCMVHENGVPKKQKKLVKMLRKKQYRKLLTYAGLSNKKAGLQGK